MTSSAAASASIRAVRVIDSHTAGEPTRVVVSGGPDLGAGPVAERRERFRRQHDAFRRALVGEPRGSDIVVGALLVPPNDPEHEAGVVFFNNVGYLGMCGHGTIGVVTTLAFLGRIGPGRHAFETPAGVVETELAPLGSVTVRNVPSYRHRASVTVQVPGIGPVVGDVAYGGNWFFLTDRSPVPLDLAHAAKLTEFTRAVRAALARAGITGADAAPIDHVEVSGPPRDPGHDARNFVLCPGGLYDRSPCGTGTSAKMACLAADGRLRPGETWRQEGILGTVFEGSVELEDGRVRPSITGRAYVTADAELLFDPLDPFRDGIPG